MSPELEIDTTLPEYLADGTIELNRSSRFGLLFNEPAIRIYMFAALGSLAMIFLMMFNQGSDIGGMMIVAVGVCGVVFQWSAAPALVLLILTFFMWTPIGIPDTRFANPFLIEERRFHFIDVVTVLSVLVYCISQFRINGLLSQALPFEGTIQRPGEPLTRRPPALIGPSELATMLGVSAAMVVVGQLIWFIATSFEIVPTQEFPMRLAASKFGQKAASEANGTLPNGASRFYILLALLVFGSLLARLVFGYARLRTIGKAEAGMILLDTGWNETNRERVRLEKWRNWGKKRNETLSLRAKAVESRDQKPTQTQRK
jgi:hypothetical protein